MLSRFNHAHLRLGTATVALALIGHAASVLDRPPPGQLAPNTWLEPVTLDGSPHEGTLGVRGDRDYFRIDVTEPTLTSVYTGGDVDTLGVLFDPEGREMIRDEGSGQRDNFRIETLLPRNGTYYLMVRAGEGFFGVPIFYAFTGNYLLHAERVRESPTALPLDGQPQEGAISTGGEVDFFRLDVTEPTLAAIRGSRTPIGRWWLVLRTASNQHGGSGQVPCGSTRRSTRVLATELPPEGLSRQPYASRRLQALALEAHL